MEAEIRIFYENSSNVTKLSTTYESTEKISKEQLVGILERAKLQFFGLDGSQISDSKEATNDL